VKGPLIMFKVLHMPHQELSGTVMHDRPYIHYSNRVEYSLIRLSPILSTVLKILNN